MSTRQDRRRFERTVARAMRPSMRSSATPASITNLMRLARRAWSWPVVGVAGISFVIVVFYLAAPYASLSWITSRRVDGAQPARHATLTGPAHDASERRRAEVREVHLRQLQPVLHMDAEQLSELARRVGAQGRVTRKDRSDSAVELRSIFVSHRVLSEDLQNHYPEYAQAKERLRRNVSEQEEEFRRATWLVMTKLPLPPGTAAEHRRSEIARGLLEKCLDRGPGMTLTTAASEDERAAFEAFTSFQPDPDAAHCESLKRRAASIAANARKLSTEARALAGRTTLAGECKYTSHE